MRKIKYNCLAIRVLFLAGCNDPRPGPDPNPMPTPDPVTPPTEPTPAPCEIDTTDHGCISLERFNTLKVDLIAGYEADPAYNRHFYGRESRTDVSLQGAIGYTSKYIVESGEEHYRYDYYRYILNTALNFFGIHRSKYKIFHLDLGCGPGLFSWVVQDYLLSRCNRINDKYIRSPDSSWMRASLNREK